MFDNIGGKIKGVAQFIAWVGIILTVILFFILTISGEEELIALSFVILIVGCLGSWLSSLTLYGFGQLVENSDSLVKINSINANITIQENECKEKSNCVIAKESNDNITNTFVSPLHKLLTENKLSEEQINEVLKLQRMKDSGAISSSNCRKQTYKIIEDLSIDKVMKILNHL